MAKPKRILRKWAVTVMDSDDVFTMLAVKDGKSVDTGRKATSVLRTKGKRTVTHAADIPKGWEKRYHSQCRVALGNRPANDPQGPGYVIIRCI
jgi:hypothetical protein